MSIKVTFLDELYLKKLRGQGRIYVIAQSFRVHIKNKDYDTVEIIIHSGFPTDFASIPRIFWSILPPVGNYDEAAVLHDYLYKTQLCTRLLSDQIFAAGMKTLDVKWWKRKVMYRGVRIGGWVAWNKHKQNRL